MDLQTLISSIIAGILEGCTYSLFSLGLNLAFGVMRIVNLSHGQFVMVGAYIAYWLTIIYGVDPYLSTLVIVPSFFIFGVFIQKFIISRIIYSPMSVSLLACFSIGLFLENTALTLWTADYKLTPRGIYDQTLVMGSIRLSAIRILGATICVLLVIVTFIFLTRTLFGKAIRGVMQDLTGAKFMGIPVNKVYLVSFGISLSLAGASGAVMSLNYPFNPFLGYAFMLKAFSVCVLGGLGNLMGAFVGGLILGVSESLVALFFTTMVKDAVAFIIIILVMLCKPHGILFKPGK